MGYLILEPPRKKHVTRSWRRRNKKHKSYDLGIRKRGSYYRVHHYVYDIHGRRKSKFCYLGNFDYALERLKQVKKILEKYATSVKPTNPKYDSIFLVWELRNLREIENTIKQAEQLNKFKKNPDRFAEVIDDTILTSQFYMIRGDRIFQKYA